MTTRGFKKDAAIEVAHLMLDVLKNRDDATVEAARAKVLDLARSHPIPESFS
jgi:glycine/serine hydroxymethyltransferase